MPKVFLDLLEIFGFIVSCNLTFIHLIDLITPIVFKPTVNIQLLYNFNSMALHSLYCADVPLRNCSLTHHRAMRPENNVSTKSADDCDLYITILSLFGGEIILEVFHPV